MFKQKNMTSPKAQTYEDCDLLIIGAGFSGAFTAQQASKALPRGSKIVLIDAHGLLNAASSSQNECFKLHTGLHYIEDDETVEKCLESSVEMAHYFPEYVLNFDDPTAPTRRGRHFLMSNSHSVKVIKEKCDKLVQYYEKLLHKFPNAKKVFGEPENFIKYLESSEYNYVANDIPIRQEVNQKSDSEDEVILFDQDNRDSRKFDTVGSASVILGIETPESQIDIQKFKDHFQYTFKYLEETLYQFYGHTVTRISHSSDILHYVIETKYFDEATQKIATREFRAKTVVNCAWQNIDIIDSHLNFDQIEKLPASIRAKILVDVSVPSSLKRMPTCIFFSGANCSVTRIPASLSTPEERLRLTYEPVTNIGNYTSGTQPYMIKDKNIRLLLHPQSAKEVEMQNAKLDAIANDIVAGCSLFIPDIKEAAIKNTGIGFVKIFAETGKGNDYLYDEKSPIHQRREDGIQKRSLGYIAFSGMKMSYAFNTSKDVIEILIRDLVAREALEEVIRTHVIQSFIDNGNQKLIPNITYSIKQYFMSIYEEKTKNDESFRKLELPALKIRLTTLFFEAYSDLAGQYVETINDHANMLQDNYFSTPKI